MFSQGVHKPGFPVGSLADSFIPGILTDTSYFLHLMLFTGFNRCILFRSKPVRHKEGFKVDFKEQTFDIAALGELLIDFTPVKVQPGMNPCFEQNPGGAPANVAVAGAKSGCRTAFIGAVGADSFGAFLRQELDSRGVNTDFLKQEPSGTTLAFVHLDKTGNRSFSFYRNPGADTLLAPADLQDFPFERCRIFHTGSLSLTAEPARSATFSALEKAVSGGAVISCDPNWRAALWKSEREGLGQIRSLLEFAELVKISEEEALLLTGIPEAERAARSLLNRYGGKEGRLKLVVVTCGASGCLWAREKDRGSVAGFPVEAVDTTGAGDAFWGAFLAEFCRTGKNTGDLSPEELSGICRYANAAGALCSTRRGAISALADRTEILEKLGKC